MPYKQPRTPRVYVNYGEFFLKKGIVTEPYFGYYSSGNGHSSGTASSIRYTTPGDETTFNTLSNNTASGLWGLNPSNFYMFNPNTDIDNGYDFYGNNHEQLYGGLHMHDSTIGWAGNSELFALIMKRWMNNLDSNGKSTAYIALVGHNFKEKDLKFVSFPQDSQGNGLFYFEPILNCAKSDSASTDSDSGGFSSIKFTRNGLSIARITGVDESALISPNNWMYWKFGIFRNNETYIDDTTNQVGNIQLGSMVFGQYYDFPHSADLSLAVSKEYDGIKTQKTMSGSTINNIQYEGAPPWGTLSSFESSNNDQNSDLSNWTSVRRFRYANHLNVTGRKKWDLGFSFLSNDQVMGENEAWNSNVESYAGSDRANISNTGGYPDDAWQQFPYPDNTFDVWSDERNIYNGRDMFSRFINPTMGGSLPFIFQPDNVDFNIQNWGICTLAQDSYTIEQTAPNLWATKMKFVETW